MPDVLGRGPSFVAQIQHVLHDAGVFARSAAGAGNGTPVADGMRPRVRNDVGHALRIALLQLGLQSVIERIPAEGMHVRTAQGDESARLASRELHITAASGRNECRPPGTPFVDWPVRRDQFLGDRIVDRFAGPRHVFVPAAHHVVHLVAEVADFPQRIAGKRVLDVEVPVLRHRPVRLGLPA